MTEEEEFEFRLRYEQEQKPVVPKAEAPSGIPQVPGMGNLLANVAKATRTKEAMQNIPGSAANMAGGLWQAVTSPLQTGQTIWDVAAGGLRKAMPDAFVAAIDKLDPNVAAGKRAEFTAEKVGEIYKSRYGGAKNIQETFATDPVGAMADLSAVAAGGGALASKVPGLAKTADALKVASKTVNPVNIAVQAGKKVVPVVGRGIAEAVNAVGPHAGGEAIKQAARSGFEGGKSAETFAANLRGKVPMTQVLDDAKANIRAMGEAKAAEYRTGMAGVSSDKTVLGFNGIDEAIKIAADSVRYKGQIKNVRAAKTILDMQKEISRWKKLNPAEYHTPEGLDALKQKLGDMLEGIPMEEKTARMVGGKIYQSVKTEITKQAPVYASVMKKYSDASEQIREIERALSLEGKASVDTAMRKLQSLTRNNVSTNYGNRLDLAKQLEAQGGREIMPALAGQALSSWQPRGLAGMLAGPIGLGGYAATGSLPVGAGLLAIQSPRLIGEAAMKTGQAARLATKPFEYMQGAGLDPATLANLMAIAGRE